MNYSTAVMLMNPNIRAISTVYEPDPAPDKKTSKRTIYKTLDQNIRKGDFVVVPTSTRHGKTVVLVDDVDVEVDFESPTEIKWVMSRVDFTDHENILREETKWIDALKASEKRKKREEIKKNMLDMYQDADIDKLAIAHMGEVPAIDAEKE